MWLIATYLLGYFPGEVRVRDKLEATLVSRLVVENLHLTVVVKPKLTHDHIVYRG